MGTVSGVLVCLITVQVRS